MDAELVRRFAFDRAKNETTLSRPGKEVQELERDLDREPKPRLGEMPALVHRPQGFQVQPEEE